MSNDPMTTAWPLSLEQRAMVAMLDRGDVPHIPVVLHVALDGALTEPQLQAGAVAAMDAHPGLPRTRGGAVLRACGNADEMQAWLAGSVGADKSGEATLPLRLALMRRSDGRWQLALAASPRVADAGSLWALATQIVNGVAPEVFQYAQFVEWRQALAQDDSAVDGEAYWTAHLGDQDLAPPRLPLRGKGVEAVRASDVRLVAHHAVTAADVGHAEAAAAAFGVDVPVVLQAAWWLTLSRLTGFTGFLAGWQHDCRMDYDVMQGAVGVFDKVLPVVVQSSARQPLRGWMQHFSGVVAAHVQAQEHWPVASPPTTVHHTVGFCFSELPAGVGCPLVLPAPLACFELALDVAWGGPAAAFTLHAQASRYAPATLRVMLAQFGAVLAQLAPRCDATLGALSLGNVAHDAPTLDAGTRTVWQCVAEWARRTPQAPALEDDHRRLDYGSLVREAEHLARGLVALGVAPGGCVSLDLPRSVDWVLALLATWRAGAAFLPLDPAWPQARKRAVMADAHATVRLDTVMLARARHLGSVDRVLPADATPEAVAYVLYTSGSTGQPKGVPIGHGQLLNYVATASDAMALADCRRWGLLGAVAADLGHTALFGALFNGACLVVADDAQAKEGLAFQRFVADRRIDAIKIVPSHLAALLDGQAPRLPPTVVLGGEAAPRQLIEQIRQAAPGGRVFNHYGPTEATVGVMVHAVPAVGPLPEVMPLSQVLANNRIALLDDQLRPAPCGALAQLFIGGAQLCDGYLNGVKPDAFVDDPQRPGQRLYRTGDLAFAMPDGSLQLAGRADHQVKIRGYRVEPAELEATLLALPGVQQAAVVAVQAPTGDATLAAFVVGTPAWDRLAELLPAQLLPTRRVTLPALPRLANGKIDRLALVALAQADTAPPATPPRDAVEAAVATCMALLLGRASLGVDDDFFSHGGNSLLAIRLVARFRNQFKADVALGTVFDQPSAAQLSAHLRRTMDAVALEAAALASLPADQREAWQARPADAAVPAQAGMTLAAPWVHMTQGGAVAGGVPLFCFPGLFVNTTEYAPVWGALAADRPLRGFVCASLSAMRWEVPSLAGMAEGYGTCIAEQAGQGGVALLGWSVGGDLAFETARWLREHRPAVAVRFVGLVDVCVPAWQTADTDAVHAASPWAGWIVRSVMAARWQSLLAGLSPQELALAAAHVRERHGELPLDGEAPDAAEYRVWAGVRHAAAWRRHTWRPADVPVHAWIAGETAAQPGPSPARDWAPLAPVRHARVVPGTDHRSLLGDATFLGELREVLRAVDQG